MVTKDLLIYDPLKIFFFYLTDIDENTIWEQVFDIWSVPYRRLSYNDPNND